MTLRLAMMGTGEFALPVFLALYETGHELVGLFTQPDRTGRGHHRHKNPLKEAAVEHGTPVFQPPNANTPEALADLRALGADLCVVAAYGQILSQELLEIPRCGAVNLHASLLPRYRGAAPIQHAVLNGETETGVTIFQIEPKLDAGPVLGVERTPIGPKETYGELQTRLADIAVPLTVRVLDQFHGGKPRGTVQNAQQATKAPRLKKADGEIDWTKSRDQIGWHIRAMQPWPKPFTVLSQDGKQPTRLIVLEVDPGNVVSDSPPGTVIDVDSNRLAVQTGDGTLEVVRLQPKGKRAMSIDAFLRGHSVQIGDRFGSAAGQESR